MPAKVQPPIVKEVPAPATRVSGAPTVRTPTAAVRKPVTVLMAVTATGADWVDTWKLAGFTVSVPAVATLNVHVLVQDAPTVNLEGRCGGGAAHHHVCRGGQLRRGGDDPTSADCEGGRARHKG